MPDRQDEESELAALHPRRVLRRDGKWVCTCPGFARTGRCPHLAAFLPQEEIEASEEYL